jgi:hypothetical protein
MIPVNESALPSGVNMYDVAIYHYNERRVQHPLI